MARPVDESLRPLLDGDRPLRAPHRRGAVHRRDAGRDRDEAPLADPGGAVDDPPGDPARPRPGRAARAREGAGRPLPVGEGDGSRPRARRARRAGRHRDRGGRDDGAARRDDGGHRRRAGAEPRSATAATSATARTTARSARGRAWWPWLSRSAPRSRSASAAGSSTTTSRTRSTPTSPSRSTTTRGSSRRTPSSCIVGDGFEPRVSAAAERRCAAAGYVFEQEPEPGTRLPKGSIVTVLVSSGKPKITVPSRRRQVARHARSRSSPSRARRDGRRGQLRPAVRHRDRAGPAAGDVARRGLVGADQRLEGAEAGRRPERRRLELRGRGRAAAGRRVHGRPRRRRERPARGRGRDAEPARQLDGVARARPSRSPSPRARRPATVPDVSLQPVADARATLRAAGLQGLGRARRRPTTSRSTASSCSRTRRAQRRPIPKSVVTITVGDVRAAARRDDRRPIRRRPTREPPADSRERARTARGARGRTVERARDLARVGGVRGRGARSRALRRADDRDRPRRPLGAPRRRPAAELPATTTAETLPVPADSAPATLGCGRRGAADPPRPVRRGRHRPGPLRARGRRVRRARACSPRRSAWTRTSSRR